MAGTVGLDMVYHLCKVGVQPWKMRWVVDSAFDLCEYANFLNLVTNIDPLIAHWLLQNMNKLMTLCGDVLKIWLQDNTNDKFGQAGICLTGMQIQYVM